MNLGRLKYCGKQFIKLGPRRSFHILENRIKTSYFNHYWRYIAHKKLANHTWNSLMKNLDVTLSFHEFFEALKKKKVICLAELYPLESFDTDRLLLKADEFVNHTFELLGSGKQTFENIPWHTDFRLQKQNGEKDCSFDGNAYYKDIHVKNGKSSDYVKDIKVPWELSRCYHFLVLGQAYELTNDEKYAQAFSSQVQDWIHKNPFLLGPNWVCGMEVGIRAVNWIWAFFMFRHSSKISETVWQKVVCSLYDHLFFLENNWEVYDSRTSNHYLSDLIGYFYLCFFFSDMKGIKEKSRWCYQELLREFEKQVFDEGTDYEESTHYHKLVTEIFYHFYLLGREFAYPLSTFFVEKLARMFDFIDWCSFSPGKIISIGDNDSGRILYYGLMPDMIAHLVSKETSGKKLFRQFGLSVLKNDQWHITLRHHSYAKHQPSSHLHNDIGSVTMAYKGKDLFVDPGSFLYTPSEVWRNRMRSATVHNMFFLDGLEPVPFDYRLFALELPCQLNNDDHFSVEHDLYEMFELRAHRKVTVDQTPNVFEITDWWSCIGTCQRVYPKVCWNFTLAPDVEAKKEDDRVLIFFHEKPLVQITSNKLSFEIVDTFVSYRYGEKQASKALRAILPFELYAKVILTIEGL